MNDPFCIKILRALQEDSRTTVQQISELVGLSSTPCWKRIKDMEASGVISGYTVKVDRKKVGLNLMVVVSIMLKEHTEKWVNDFESAVSAEVNIVSCYATTGAADYVLHVVIEDIDKYDLFLKRVLLKLPGISTVSSSMVLRESKISTKLPF
jgi:DNA-binding Lrp family transcriptional regulator